MPRRTIYVGRPTKWGNCFTVGCEAWRYSTTIPYANPETLPEVLEDYRYWLRDWQWQLKTGALTHVGEMNMSLRPSIFAVSRLSLVSSSE